VDYAQRAVLLRRVKSSDATTLLRAWPDGRVKLFTTWKLLDVRARHPELFRDGGYQPLDIDPHVCAFVRRHGDDVVAVAVPRFTTRLSRPGQFPLGDVWRDTALPLSGRWRNTFTGEEVSGDALPLRDVFARFPVAVLERG